MGLGVLRFYGRGGLWVQDGDVGPRPRGFLDYYTSFFCFFMGPFSSAPAKASFAASSPPLHLGFRVTTRSCPIHPIIKEYCLTYLGLYAMI